MNEFILRVIKDASMIWRGALLLSVVLVHSRCSDKLLTQGPPPGETTAEPMENPASIMSIPNSSKTLEI